MERGQRGAGTGARLDFGRVNCAKPKHADRHFFLGASVAGKIFSAHFGIDGFYVVCSEPGGQCAPHPAGERGIVVGGGGEFSLGDGDHRHAILGDPGGDRLAAADALQRLDGVVAHRVGVGAERELEFHLVRDDVVFRATVDGADSDYRGVDGPRFAADDGLQRKYDARSEDDRVLGGMRVGTVAADAADGDVDAVDVRHRVAFDRADRAGGQGRAVVQRDGVVRLGKLSVKSLGQHDASADPALLGGLANQHHGASPAVFERGQQAGGAGKHRHVNIVTAGLHRCDLAAGEIFHAGFARIRHSGLLFHREPVEIRPDQQGRPWAVLQHADDAKAAKSFHDFKARVPQFPGHDAGSALLHQRKLGVRVKIFVERVERGVLRGDFLRDQGAKGIVRRGHAGHRQKDEGQNGEQGAITHGRKSRAGFRAGLAELGWDR